MLQCYSSFLFALILINACRIEYRVPGKSLVSCNVLFIATIAANFGLVSNTENKQNLYFFVNKNYTSMVILQKSI